MIEMGIVVGMGLLITLIKMAWKWKLWMLSNPILMDYGIFLALLLIHWGTFSGVMVATVGAMTCSLTLSAARWLVGHIEDGTYVPGYYDMSHKVS